MVNRIPQNRIMESTSPCLNNLTLAPDIKNQYIEMNIGCTDQYGSYILILLKIILKRKIKPVPKIVAINVIRR